MWPPATRRRVADTESFRCGARHPPGFLGGCLLLPLPAGQHPYEQSRKTSRNDSFGRGGRRRHGGLPGRSQQWLLGAEQRPLQRLWRLCAGLGRTGRVGPVAPTQPETRWCVGGYRVMGDRSEKVGERGQFSLDLRRIVGLCNENRGEIRPLSRLRSRFLHDPRNGS